MKTCQYCILQMCFLCETPQSDDTECCCKGTFGINYLTESTKVGKDYSKLPMSQVPPNHRAALADREYMMGRPRSEDGDLKSPTEAGRIRANEVAPIQEGDECDWAMLKYAGGSIEPLVGCAGNLAEHRHHGPSKSTLDNRVGINLHKICTSCHNRFHALNDKYYGSRPRDNSEYLPLPEFGECKPHDKSTQATPKEVIKANAWWNKDPKTRGNYRSWERREVNETSG